MKKLLIPLLFIFVLPASFSCGSSRLAGYRLTEADAIAAIRQLLEIGSRDGIRGAFSKDAIMSVVFPGELRKLMNTLQQLGLSGEVDRFTTTLSMAAEKTAERSIPIFLKGIADLKFTDAIRIVKNGGTSATDYLRTSIGPDLRRAITPVMQTALDEYKLGEQWSKVTKPVQALTGNIINLDLANLMAGLVSEKMFQKIGEKETQVRTDASARTSGLLQKVFSRKWN